MKRGLTGSGRGSPARPRIQPNQHARRGAISLTCGTTKFLLFPDAMRRAGFALWGRVSRSAFLSCPAKPHTHTHGLSTGNATCVKCLAVLGCRQPVTLASVFGCVRARHRHAGRTAGFGAEETTPICIHVFDCSTRPCCSICPSAQVWLAGNDNVAPGFAAPGLPLRGTESAWSDVF